MTDDELISLYVDGQLTEADKAAFDARLRSDAVLRHRTSVTHLLTREARRMPELAVPRNFILSRTLPTPKGVQIGERKSSSLIPGWVYRLGSVAAAGLFVVLIGAEALAPRAAVPMTTAENVLEAEETQIQAPSAMTAIVNTPLAQSILSTGEANASADAVATASDAMMQSAPAAPAVESSSARSVPASQPQAKAAQTDIRPADAVSETQLPPYAAELVVTPVPTPAAVVESQLGNEPTPLVTPTRLFAVMALLAALVLGALGWLRRQ